MVEMPFMFFVGAMLVAAGIGRLSANPFVASPAERLAKAIEEHDRANEPREPEERPEPPTVPPPVSAQEQQAYITLTDLEDRLVSSCLLISDKAASTAKEHDKDMGKILGHAVLVFVEAENLHGWHWHVGAGQIQTNYLADLNKVAKKLALYTAPEASHPIIAGSERVQ